MIYKSSGKVMLYKLILWAFDQKLFDAEAQNQANLPYYVIGLVKAGIVFHRSYLTHSRKV